MLETDTKISKSMIEGLVRSRTRIPFSGTVTILIQFKGGHEKTRD